MSATSAPTIAPTAEPVEKVTIFVLGQRDGVSELLLLYHPNAGIQLPAGTVEVGEAAMAAVLREAQEETGLHNLAWGGMIAVEREEFPPGTGIMALPTPVYTTFDNTSASWATLRRGLLVTVLRGANGFLQVRYTENNRYPDPQYVTFEVTGWVPASTVAAARVRHFAWLASLETTPPSWTYFADHHNFTLRWHPLDALPELVEPQAPWLRHLPNR